MLLRESLAGGMVWHDGEVVDDHLEEFELAGVAHAPAALVWVDLVRPGPDVLLELAERLGLSPTVVEDATAPHERPKVTRHGDHLFFTVYTTRLAAPDAPDPGAGRVRTARVSGLVLPRMLITLRLDESVDMAPVVRRWRESADLVAEGGALALVHGLLDVVVDGHFETIQALDEQIEQIEDDLFGPGQREPLFVRRLYGYRKDLVALRRVVLPMREVVNAVLRHRGYPGGQLDHWYDDLYDHVLRASEWTDSLRDMVTTVFDTHLSLQDTRLNEVMKRLAGWAAIIAVPTAITGWFGQNLPYPGFQQPLGLWLSIALILGCAGVLYVSFRRQGWV